MCERRKRHSGAQGESESQERREIREAAERLRRKREDERSGVGEAMDGGRDAQGRLAGLVREAKRDPLRLGDLLEYLRPWIRDYLKGRYGRQSADADDLVQEVLRRIGEGLDKYHERDKFPLWVKKIAANVFFSWDRARKAARRDHRRERSIDAGDAPELQDRRPGPEELLEKKEELLEKKQRRLLLECLRRLQEEHPAWFDALMQFIERLSLEEAAAKAGSTPDAQNMRRHYAKKFLLDCLRGKGF